MSYRFTIPGETVHHPRPRVTRTGRAYMPAAYRRWKDTAVQILRSYPDAGWPLEPPFSVDLNFYFTRPKSRTRAYNKNLITPRFAARGDLDNAIKSTLDALQDAGIIANDSGVWEIRARQWFCHQGQDPLTIIDIRHGSGEA